MTPVKSGYTVAIKQHSKDGTPYWSLTKIVNEGPLMYSRKMRFVDAIMTEIEISIMERFLGTTSYDELRDNIRILHFQPTRGEVFGMNVQNYDIVSFVKRNEKLMKARYTQNPLYKYAQQFLQKTEVGS